ncbi:MAG: efflux RND transporter periplasmic adaptor subunit [Betaproteobacteria bacterium]|nr:MAG: efflux RND transporter periplasmic adaptor subunit [Betaproteobacteria bacterium]
MLNPAAGVCASKLRDAPKKRRGEPDDRIRGRQTPQAFRGSTSYGRVVHTTPHHWRPYCDTGHRRARRRRRLAREQARGRRSRGQGCDRQARSKVSGEIRQVTVREGQAVKAGQVIVRFDTADLEAKLTDRIGALEASRAQLALAEKQRAQNQLLLKQKFISQTAYDAAESNLSVTQGTLKSIEAQAQLAKNALRDAVVTAPISGIVAKRHVQPGEKVNFDAPLVTVVDLAQMELQAMVPANDTPALAVGMKVALAIDGFGERRFAGTIERINPTTEAGTRAILVFIHIPNPDAALRGGMFGTGQVILAAGAPVPTLPAVAIRTEAGQTFVWTIENGKLARRIVTVGRRDDSAGRVEIKNALSPGVPVLAAPFDNLKAGAPALVRAATSPKAAGAG